MLCLPGDLSVAPCQLPPKPSRRCVSRHPSQSCIAIAVAGPSAQYSFAASVRFRFFSLGHIHCTCAGRRFCAAASGKDDFSVAFKSQSRSFSESSVNNRPTLSIWHDCIQYLYCWIDWNCYSLSIHDPVRSFDASPAQVGLWSPERRPMSRRPACDSYNRD